jgi:hypothetical protein
MARLKVYRTPIGFHDAYVAAPSQKAALEAWGADANLFARGVAEQVTDPALTEEALARPGEVIRKLRGGLDEHLDALPKTTKAPGGKEKPARPRPSRAALDAAEAALAALAREQAAQAAELKRREEALARERRTLTERHARETARLEEKRDRARRAYDAAMDRWRASP